MTWGKNIKCWWCGKPIDEEYYVYHVKELHGTKDGDKMKAEIVKDLAKGLHKGFIEKIEERDVNTSNGTYTYVDFHLNVEGTKIKTNAPFKISLSEEGKAKSKLAGILLDFGMNIEAGMDITKKNIEDVCLNKDVEILVDHEEGKDKILYPTIKSMKKA